MTDTRDSAACDDATRGASVLCAFRRAVGADPPGLRAERLRSGFSHETWRVRADGDERGWLVKIAERWPRPSKVENNVAAQRLAAEHGVPVPEVVATGLDGAELGRPYYVQRWVDGVDAETALPAMSAAARAAFAADLGRMVARLHGIAGPCFAEGVLPTMGVDGWKAWCRTRLVQLRELNERAGVLDAAELGAALTGCARLIDDLDDAFAPALAHRDLWLMNVVVAPDAADAATRVAAILDFEHARFADPAWDFAKLEFLTFRPHPDLARPFLAAYCEARGWSDAFEVRIRLCRGLELLRSVPYFGVEAPNPELLGVMREALATDSRAALRRWLG